MHKSYNEIVDTCKLVAYKEEFTSKNSVWVEYWEDCFNSYRCLFTPNSDSTLPLTYFTEPINDFS